MTTATIQKAVALVHIESISFHYLLIPRGGHTIPRLQTKAILRKQVPTSLPAIPGLINWCGIIMIGNIHSYNISYCTPLN